MAVPSSAITRFELGATFSEFNLAMNRMGFIGPSALRPRMVGIQSADVGKIKLEQLLRQESNKRASGGGYRRSDFEFDKYNYSTEEYGHESPMDDRQVAVYADILDAETIYSQRAIDAVLGEYERDCATLLYDTTVWTGAALTTTITVPWSTHATATPIDDVISAREDVVSGSGLEPNALILNKLQYYHLINTNQIVDRVKYTQVATQQALQKIVAEVLGIEFLLVAGGLKNAANPQQARSISRIWSNTYAMLARVAVTDDPQEPCVGRTFMWSGDGPGSPGTSEELAVVVEEYREEGVRSSVLRARNDRQVLVMYKEAGNLMTGVL